jgi:ubiquinone/menaquinone biosynthesis C-methylase UbiE
LQHIVEATAMARFATASYDFVLASHVLEHIANPILALCEWKRLLKDRGVLVLLLPHKDKTFDHRRPVTTLEHLIADFKAGMT